MKYDPDALTRHVLDCAQQGMSQIETAELLRVSPSTIARICSAANIKLERKKREYGPNSDYYKKARAEQQHNADDAEDVLMWANAGPGAMRGLNRLTGRELGYSKRSHDWVSEMQELYKIVQTRLPAHILQRNDMRYEMREIEGGLCEFDKYSRIVKGEGRTRSIYKENNLPMVEDLINGESKYG